MLKRFGNVGMAAVRVRRIEKAQSVIVAVEEKAGETVNSQSGLMRVVSGADRTRAHREAAGLNAGLAERDGICSRKLARQGPQGEGKRLCATSEPSGM